MTSAVQTQDVFDLQRKCRLIDMRWLVYRKAG